MDNQTLLNLVHAYRHALKVYQLVLLENPAGPLADRLNFIIPMISQMADQLNMEISTNPISEGHKNYLEEIRRAVVELDYILTEQEPIDLVEFCIRIQKQIIFIFKKYYKQKDFAELSDRAMVDSHWIRTLTILYDLKELRLMEIKEIPQD